MTCSRCGRDTAADDRFCGYCGTPVAGEMPGTEHTAMVLPGPGTGSGAVSAVGSGRHAELTSGTAMLVVHRGPGEGQEFLLDPAAGVLRIGRSEDSDIFLDDVTVSRHHAELRHGAEGWSLRDVGSLNGTYVNRARVDDQRLAGGDEVQIGKFRFVMLVGIDSTS